jgi:hypothetical protein
VRRVLFAAMSALACCSDPLDPASRVDSLRVLAVRADPPFVKPGETSQLSMLLVDRPGAERPVHVVWLAGCDEPEGDLPSSCFPVLARRLEGVSDEELGRDDLAVPGVLGHGTSFSLETSPDAISRRPPPPEGIVPYALSYVFFAACAGEIRKVPLAEASHGIPLGCFGDEGAELGAEDFVVGYVPVRVYVALRNDAPVIESTVMDGRGPSHAPCVSDEECPAGEGCSARSRCVPVVPACRSSDEDDCPHPSFAAVVGPSSVEIDLTTRPETAETVWIAYFTDAGRFEDDARLVSDPGSGIRGASAQASKFLPGRGVTGSIRWWAVAHDNRMGVSWIEEEAIVR